MLVVNGCLPDNHIHSDLSTKSHCNHYILQGVSLQTFFVGCHIVHVLDSFTREKSFVQKSASTRFITGREDFIRSFISLLFSTQCIAFKASLQQLPHLEYCPETPGQPLRDISH